MATTELAVIEQELAPEGQSLEATARTYLIVDADSLALADALRRACKEGEDKAEAKFGPICRDTDRAHKAAVALRDELKGAFARAAKLFGTKMADWDKEQARIRREAEAAQAREQARLEAIEAQRVVAEAAQRLREAEDARLDQAAEAEARGDTATAERIISAPVEVVPVAPRPVFVPPAPIPEYQRPAGTSYPKRWEAACDDLSALIGSVAAGTVTPIVALQLLDFNESGARAFAKSTNGHLTVPGVTFRQVTGTRQTR